MGLQKKQLIPNNQGFKVKIKMKYMKWNVWTHVPLNTGRVWWPLHHQDNHAGNAAI